MILGKLLDLHKAQSTICKRKLKINALQASVRILKDQAKYLALKKHPLLVSFPSTKPCISKTFFCPTKSFVYKSGHISPPSILNGLLVWEQELPTRDLLIMGSRILGGGSRIYGTCQRVSLESMKITSVHITHTQYLSCGTYKLSAASGEGTGSWYMFTLRKEKFWSWGAQRRQTCARTDLGR